MIFRAIKVLIITFFITTNGYSQNGLDSLYLELASVKNDTNKVNTLNSISWEYRTINAIKALKFNKEALALATKLNYSYGIACTYDILGTIYRYGCDNINALKNYFKALELYDKTSDQNSIGNVYNYIGHIYNDIGEYEKSLEYYEKAYNIFMDINYYEGLAFTSNNIGITYKAQGNDSIALHYYEKAFEMNKKINRSKGMGYASMNIGIIFMENQESLLAKDYYQKSLNLMLKSKDPKGLALIYINISTVFLNLQQADSAYHYLSKAMSITKKHSLLNEKKEVLYLLSNVYYNRENYKKAYNELTEYLHIKDSLFSITISNKVLELERQFAFEQNIKNQEYEIAENSKQLKINKLQIYILLLSIFLLIIITAVVIYRKIEKIKNINASLKSKNNDLSNLAMYILQKNNLIMDFRKQLIILQKKLKAESNNVEVVDEIINSLIFKIAISKDIEEFRDTLRELSEEFYSKLDKSFPDLTDKEKQLATLLRIDLTSKQIAVIFDISPDSVDKNRYRLRKKIGLIKDENISSFFKQI